MDILTHTLSGVAVGSILVSFSKEGFYEKSSIVILSGIGGAFPDVDAISMWSKFDNTIGKLFALEHSGREIYSSKFWYSHHAFFHSLVAAILFAIVFLAALYLLRRVCKGKISFPRFVKEHNLIPIAFFGGYLMHLLGDMPTPAASWGGVNFLWPSHNYIGGTGAIWWWNNYDIFLIIMGCILLNLLVYVVSVFMKLNKRAISVAVGLFCFLFILIQIHNRTIDFNYSGHFIRFSELEQQSKHEQERILGKRLYKVMEKLDNKLPFNF
jgi:inner membrane protein